MKMKAAMYLGRENVRLEEVDVPDVAPGEVLVKVKVALTCGTDRKMYLRDHPLFKPPFIFGHEFAGDIASVGEGVEAFEEGMRVAPVNSAPCNVCYHCKVGNHSMCEDLFIRLSGAFAEYAIVPAPIVRQNLLPIPEHVSYRTAALLEPLACVVHGIERSGIRMGDTVVVNGVGPIGLMFVALAVLKGARVIATDVLPERLVIAQKLGAHETVDASQEADQVAAVRSLTEGDRGVDVAIEAAGVPEVWEKTIAMVRKGGIANLFGGCKSGTTITVDTALIHYSEVTIKGVFHHTPNTVKQAMNLLSVGAIDSDVFITRELPLSQMPEIIELLLKQEGIKTAVVP